MHLLRTCRTPRWENYVHQLLRCVDTCHQTPYLVHTGASAIPDLGPIDIGKARRTGQTVSPTEDNQGFPQAQFAPDLRANTNGNGAAAVADTPAASSGAAGANAASTSMSMDAMQSQVC